MFLITYKEILCLFLLGGSGLVPIGRFFLNHSEHDSGIPILKLNLKIRWPGGRGPPPDRPECGFNDELCPTHNVCDILIGVIGGVTAILVFVGCIAYR